VAEDSLGPLAARIDRAANRLTGDVLRKALEELGRAGVDDAHSAVVADIRDMSMSRWRTRKGAPIDVKANWQIEGDAVRIAPFGRTAGPWRVLEDGRQAASAGTFRSRGSRTRKSDGAQSTRIVLRTRSVGAMAGKQTWSDAVEVMARETPKRAEEAIGRRTVDMVVGRF
jgi:hypothetical protein